MEEMAAEPIWIPFPLALISFRPGFDFLPLYLDSFRPLGPP
jgi:hypothetical protein